MTSLRARRNSGRTSLRASAATAAATAVLIAARAGGVIALPHRSLRLPGAHSIGEGALLCTFAAAAIAVLGLLWLLARVVRRPRDDSPQQVVTPIGTRWSRALAALVAGGLLLLPVAVLVLASHLSSNGSPPQIGSAPAPTASLPPGATRSPAVAKSGPGSDLQGVLLAAVVVVGTVVAAGLASRHLRAPASVELDTPGASPTIRGDLDRLASATVAAGLAVTRPGSARAAVIDAYLAMEREIINSPPSAAARRTPRQLLRLAVQAGHANPQATRTVVSLFEKARFSDHDVTEADRRAAQQALSAIHAGLPAAAPRS